MKGKFITIEGPDGAGKTTQAEKIAAYLRQRGYKVYLTREPGGTALGEKIRGLLLDPLNKEMSFKTEVLLYAAARAQIVAEKIVPALERGEIVLCDRYVDSSIAYQGYGRNIDLQFVKEINRLVVNRCMPDLTILLDLPAEEGLRRLVGRGEPDRLEGEASDFHRRVRRGFLEIAAEEPERVRVICAEKPPETVLANMIKLIEETVF